MATVLKHLVVLSVLVVMLAALCSAVGNNTTTVAPTTAGNNTINNSTVAPTTKDPRSAANVLPSCVFIAVGSLLMSFMVNHISV